MKIFVSDAGNRARQEYCIQNGIGLLYSPSYFVPPPARADYIVDNGAYIAYQKGRAWDPGPYMALLHRISDEFPKYLPVQQGMEWQDIEPLVEVIDGILVGGPTVWKWRTAGRWIEYGHDRGLLVHIGVVGTKQKYDRAWVLGADSVDGSYPMRHNCLHIIPEWRAERVNQARIGQY